MDFELCAALARCRTTTVAAARRCAAGVRTRYASGLRGLGHGLFVQSPMSKVQSPFQVTGPSTLYFELLELIETRWLFRLGGGLTGNCLGPPLAPAVVTGAWFGAPPQ